MAVIRSFLLSVGVVIISLYCCVGSAAAVAKKENFTSEGSNIASSIRNNFYWKEPNPLFAEERNISTALENWSNGNAQHRFVDYGNKFLSTVVHVQCESTHRLNYFTEDNMEAGKFDRLISQMVVDVSHGNASFQHSTWRHASLIMEMVLHPPLPFTKFSVCIPYCNSLDEEECDHGNQDAADVEVDTNWKIASLALDVQIGTVTCRGLEMYFTLDGSFIKVLTVENHVVVPTAVTKRRLNGSVVIQAFFSVSDDLILSRNIRCTLHLEQHLDISDVLNYGFIFSVVLAPIVALCCILVYLVWNRTRQEEPDERGNNSNGEFDSLGEGEGMNGLLVRKTNEVTDSIEISELTETALIVNTPDDNAQKESLKQSAAFSERVGIIQPIKSVACKNNLTVEMKDKVNGECAMMALQAKVEHTVLVETAE